MNIYSIYIISYLLGSIPFGLILTSLFGLGDVRAIGSGNIGATNVLRTGNKFLALATLLLDFSKGYFAVINAAYFYESSEILIAGIFAILGHIFPIWLRFKGGKGVATALGVFFAINYLIGLIFIAFWLIIFAITKYSSLSAILAFFFTDLFITLALNDKHVSYFIFTIFMIIIITHRQNIARLFSGSETKSNFKR